MHKEAKEPEMKSVVEGGEEGLVGTEDGEWHAKEVVVVLKNRLMLPTLPAIFRLAAKGYS